MWHSAGDITRQGIWDRNYANKERLRNSQNVLYFLAVKYLSFTGYYPYPTICMKMKKNMTENVA